MAEAGKKHPFDRDRFKNLVHYVAWAAEKHGGFNATKLYTALWFAEAHAFVLRGRPLSGAEYFRDKDGPVPRLGKIIRDELADEGRIVGADAIRALLPPDLSFLSPPEKQELDDWIERVALGRSSDVDRCWQIAEVGEALPFYAFMATRIRDALTDQELDWAKESARKLGLR